MSFLPLMYTNDKIDKPTLVGKFESLNDNT